MSDDKPKFSFSNVAANCDEHIDRSIRGFNHLRDDVVKFSKYFVTEGTTCFDIGCSEGTLLQQIRNYLYKNDKETKGFQDSDDYNQYEGSGLSKHMYSFTGKETSRGRHKEGASKFIGIDINDSFMASWNRIYKEEGIKRQINKEEDKDGKVTYSESIGFTGKPYVEEGLYFGVFDITKFDFNNINFYLAPLEKLRFVISLLTIQFIQHPEKKSIYKNIYDKLEIGGAFVLAEKVYSPSAKIQNMMDSLQEDYKSKYFELIDIKEKEVELRSLFELQTEDEIRKELSDVGFTMIDVFWRNLNFVGLIAIKS